MIGIIFSKKRSRELGFTRMGKMGEDKSGLETADV